VDIFLCGFHLVHGSANLLFAPAFPLMVGMGFGPVAGVCVIPAAAGYGAAGLLEIKIGWDELRDLLGFEDLNDLLNLLGFENEVDIDSELEAAMDDNIYGFGIIFIDSVNETTTLFGVFDETSDTYVYEQDEFISMLFFEADEY